MLQLESHTPDTLLSVEGIADLGSNKCVPLPSDLEQEIKVSKGSEPLGKSHRNSQPLFWADDVKLL